MDNRIEIIYDGECPFCSQYVKMVRLNKTFEIVDLINARDSQDPVAQLALAKFDIDQGMAVRVADQWHYGSDAIHIIALSSTPSGVFNRLNHWIFQSPGRTRLLYPMMRAGRNLALRLLGRTKINAAGPDKTSV